MILGILQARTSSTRFAGKVLRPLLGRPMIARQLERLSRCRCLDQLVVATSVRADDDAIAALCADLAIDCQRGPAEDVLARFTIAAKPYRPNQVVRLTADCPLIDWSVIDDLVALHLKGGYDYSTNALRRSYQRGLDCEVASSAAMAAAAEEASDPYEREHVMPFIYRRPERFRVGHLVRSEDLSFLRWTVDAPVDFEFVNGIYEALHPVDTMFTTEDVMALLSRRPELRFVNVSAQEKSDRQRAREYWAAFDRQSPQ